MNDKQLIANFIIWVIMTGAILWLCEGIKKSAYNRGWIDGQMHVLKAIEDERDRSTGSNEASQRDA